MRHLLIHWSREDAAAWVAKIAVGDRPTVLEHNSMVIAIAALCDAVASPWDVMGPAGDPVPQRIRVGDDEVPLIGAIEPRAELFSDPTGPERLKCWTELTMLLDAMGKAEAVDDHDLAHESESTEVVILCAPASRAVFSEADVAATRVVDEPADLRTDVASLISSAIVLARATAATDRKRTARADAAIVLRDVQQATERVLAVAGNVALNAVWRLISKSKRRAA